MAAMETQELTDDDAVIVHRERAKAKLPEIAQQVKQALAAEGIDTPIYFIVPHSGDAIVTFGTSGDPGADEWGRVADVVASVVRQAVGLAGTRCREVVCATTHDHESPQSSLQPTEPSLR
jgi:hypothetical protein